jgi:hypothetical protein
VAALELRNKTYRVVFMYAGKKYAYSLDTAASDIAEALRGGVEKTLMLLNQGLLHLDSRLKNLPQSDSCREDPAWLRRAHSHQRSARVQTGGATWRTFCKIAHRSPGTNGT